MKIAVVETKKTFTLEGITQEELDFLYHAVNRTDVDEDAAEGFDSDMTKGVFDAIAPHTEKKFRAYKATRARR